MAGRPLKFKSVEELQKGIEAYFESCYDYKRDQFGNRIQDSDSLREWNAAHPDEQKTVLYVMQKVQVFTVTGLAVALDTTRDTLMDYESGKYDDRDEDNAPVELTASEQEYNSQVELFSDTIKRAKQIIYNDTEQQLFSAGKSTGAIFSLKNNYGWRDRTETELSNPDGSMTPTVRIIDERPQVKSRSA